MTARGRLQRRELGLTLIELVVATAIFALVAVMATQALTGGLIQRRGLERAEAEGAALIRLLAQLRQDLEAAVPWPYLPALGAAAPALAPGPDGAGFALSRAAPGPGLAPQRVRWRLDPNTGILWRRSTPLIGAAGDAPEVALAEGVVALRLVPLGPWPQAPEGLPAGFAVELDSRRHGTIRLVVAR